MHAVNRHRRSYIHGRHGGSGYAGEGRGGRHMVALNKAEYLHPHMGMYFPCWQVEHVVNPYALDSMKDAPIINCHGHLFVQVKSKQLRMTLIDSFWTLDA